MKNLVVSDHAETNKYLVPIALHAHAYNLMNFEDCVK